MKMNKRIAMLLATTMALSTLAACGSDNTSVSSSSSSSGSSSGGSTTGTTLYSQEGQRNTTGASPIEFPLSSPLTFDFHYHARNKYVFKPEWPVFQEMASLTNISFNNTGNPVGTNSDTEISLESSKGYPSDIYGGNNTASYYMDAGPEGLFYALDDYWEYLPNFSAYLDENPDVAATICAVDGKIYHVPYIAEGGVARTYHIRQDWLDNLGLEIPDTVEDLEKVLIAFRDDDPNGNGLNDEIPYFNDKWNEMIRLVNLWDARCYATDTYTERVVVAEDGKNLYHAWMADEFLTAIENVSRWYGEGLIDQQVFTKENSARPEYLPGDTGGMTHEWVASTSAYNAVVTVPGFNFVTMAPPLSDGGNRWEEHARIKVKPDGWAISTNCDEADVGALFTYMDYFWSEEGRILSNWGVEGDQWEYVDGVPTFFDGVLDGSLTANKAVNSYLEEDVGAQLKHGYWQDYTYEWQWTNEIGQAGVEMYTAADGSAKYGVNVLPQLNYTTEEQKVYDAYVSGINDYLDAKIQSWVVGDWTKIAGEWDAHLAEMEALGVSQLLNNYQQAYDRYLSIMS